MQKEPVTTSFFNTASLPETVTHPREANAYIGVLEDFLHKHTLTIRSGKNAKVTPREMLWLKDLSEKKLSGIREIIQTDYPELLRRFDAALAGVMAVLNDAEMDKESEGHISSIFSHIDDQRAVIETTLSKGTMLTGKPLEDFLAMLDRVATAKEERLRREDARNSRKK